MVLALFPTKEELRPFARLLQNSQDESFPGREGVSGLLGGRKVTALVSGIGQANTAQSLAAFFSMSVPELAILGGCAGAYEGAGLKAGDVAAASEEIYADLGVLTHHGLKGFEETGLPLLETDGSRYYNSFKTTSDTQRLEAAADRVFRREAGNASFKVGIFLTVSIVSGTAERGRRLREFYGAVCENMEGAAAAQVCLLYGVPFLEVRGISNMVEDRDRSKWQLERACESSAAFIREYLITNPSPGTT
ncbi:MAG: futalosine hydrolase [Nitrospirota bacterium]